MGNDFNASRLWRSKRFHISFLNPFPNLNMELTGDGRDERSTPTRMGFVCEGSGLYIDC
jgi:hypothetical protein